MLVVYICAALKISTGTPASRGPSATAGLLVSALSISGFRHPTPTELGYVIVGEQVYFSFFKLSSILPNSGMSRFGT